MKIIFRSSFKRDAKKAPVLLQKELAEVIEHALNADKLDDIPNLKKIKGGDNAFRIKLSDYRICFFYNDKVIDFVRFLPWKDIYKFFP